MNEELPMEFPMEVLPEFADLILFDNDTIWTIEQVIGNEISKFNGDLSTYAQSFLQIIEKGCECDEEKVLQVYEEINKGSRVPQDFKTIVKYLVVSKHLASSEILDKKYYDLILEVTKKLKKIEKFRLGAFCDILISKLLNLHDSNPPFSELIESFQFIYRISKIIEPVFSIESQLYDLTSPIKLYLFKKMEDRSLENVKETIALIFQAEEHCANLKAFKECYKMDIENWIGLNYLPEDFDVSMLTQEVKLKDFDDWSEDVTDDKVEEESFKFEPVVKIKPLYMTQQETVQVSVWQVKREDGEIIAMKECIGPSLESLAGYLDEDRHLRFLSGKSKNFLKYYGSNISNISLGDVIKTVLTVHMEFVDATLKTDKLLRDQRNQPYHDLEIENIYKQLIVAFNLLRDLNILHCDIKPSNIMITKNLVIKIIDFNAAKVGINEATLQIAAVGTKDFMSPEMRKGLETKSGAIIKEDKADVYSLGMTILYLITKEPLVDLNLLENQKKLEKIINSIKYEWLKPILFKMLDYDYISRPGLKDLISHFSTDLTMTQET